MTSTDKTTQPLYHGTRADLLGDLIAPGYTSNYGSRRKANYVYVSATLGAAIWGAELAAGKVMRDHLEELKRQGIEAIDE